MGLINDAIVAQGGPAPAQQLGQMDQGFVNRFNTQNTRFGANGGAGAAVNAGQMRGVRNGMSEGMPAGMGRTQMRLGGGAGMLGSRVNMGVGEAQKRFGGGVMPGYSDYQKSGNPVQQARMTDAQRSQMGAQMANGGNMALAGYMMAK